MDIKIDLKKDDEKYSDENLRRIRFIKSSVVSFVSVGALAYFLYMGFQHHMWYVCWVAFLAVPIIESIFDCIIKKTPVKFAYPVLALAIYMIIGFKGLWHPGWIVFLTVPVYYSIATFIEKLIRKDY